MARFRSKVVEIDAEQFILPVGMEPGQKGLMFMAWPVLWDDKGPFLLIPTLEDHNANPHRASHGDWIVTGLKGEHYPVKPDIFALKYEAV